MSAEPAPRQPSGVVQPWNRAAITRGGALTAGPRSYQHVPMAGGRFLPCLGGLAAAAKAREAERP
jgi:hypothetical protein